ncbi:MAG: hypothetical protein SFU25_08035 [Candidatus Caenarcaniphilales bacterium]|nr:hypothetical protein [Candidatus Caenarcaniphilales bacterium]
MKVVSRAFVSHLTKTISGNYSFPENPFHHSPCFSPELDLSEEYKASSFFIGKGESSFTKWKLIQLVNSNSPMGGKSQYFNEEYYRLSDLGLIRNGLFFSEKISQSLLDSLIQEFSVFQNDFPWIKKYILPAYTEIDNGTKHAHLSLMFPLGQNIIEIYRSDLEGNSEGLNPCSSTDPDLLHIYDSINSLQAHRVNLQTGEVNSWMRGCPYSIANYFDDLFQIKSFPDLPARIVLMNEEGEILENIPYTRSGLTTNH